MRKFFKNYKSKKQKRNIAIALFLILVILYLSNSIFESDKNYKILSFTERIAHFSVFIGAHVYYYYYFSFYKLGFMPKYDKNSLAHKVSMTKVDNFISPNKSLCYSSDQNLVLVAFVVIAPDRFEKRMKIRNTWANHNSFSNMKVFFSLGRSRNSTVNKMIRDEALLYNDILQVDFVDSYYKIINKVLLTYKWVSLNCQNAKYVLRINDDVVVNSLSLIKYLKTAYKKRDIINNTAFGNIMYFGLIVRDVQDKFYVPFEKINKPYYDPYPEGTAFIITADLAARFFYLGFSKLKPFTHTEDVFIGMMVKHDSVNLVNIGDKFPIRIQYDVIKREEKIDLIDRMDVNDVLFVYEADEIEFIWNHLLKKLKV